MKGVKLLKMKCECGHKAEEHKADGLTFSPLGECLVNWCRCHKFKRFEGGKIQMRFNSDSTLEVTRIVDTWTDERGLIHHKSEKEIIESPLELGSLKNPKETNIINIKYNIPSRQQRGSGVVDFRGLFGL